MLGAEYGVQRNSRSLGQDVNGAASLRINSSLIGQQPDSLLGRAPANQIKVVRFQDVDSSLHRSVPYRQPAGTRLGFVIASNTFQSQLFFFTDGQWQGRGYGGGNLCAQRNHISLAARMN